MRARTSNPGLALFTIIFVVSLIMRGGAKSERSVPTEGLDSRTKTATRVSERSVPAQDLGHSTRVEVERGGAEMVVESPPRPVGFVIDQTVEVPEWRWVDVVNTTGITQRFANGERTLKFGDACGIKEGGILTVRGFDGDWVLVSYQAPSPQIGTPCPTGTVFFIHHEDLANLNRWPVVNHRRSLSPADKSIVDKLLAE